MVSADERDVARHYDAMFEGELQRLLTESPVELRMTLRWLRRYVPPGATVAEIGVGGGHYTEMLAGAGCSLHLVDISGRLLDAVRGRLDRAGFTAQIAGVHNCSATALELAPASVDVVLLMGPLYHLCNEEDRVRSAAEATRVLRPGGMLFAAGINRMAYLRDALRLWGDTVIDRRAFHQEYLCNGNLDAEHAPPIGRAHLTTAAAFRGMFSDYEEELFAGVESFATPVQEAFSKLGEAQQEAWLDLVENTCTWPEAVGVADHYLFVGRKVR